MTGVGDVPRDLASFISGTQRRLVALERRRSKPGAVGPPGGLTIEEVRDIIGATLVAGSNVTISVNDAGNTVTITATGGGGGGDSLHPGTGENSIALGVDTEAVGDAAIALGDTAVANDYYAIAIGNYATASLSDGIAIGRVSEAEEDGAIAIGYSSDAAGEESMSIGYLSAAYGLRSVALGRSAVADHDASVAIGTYAFTSADNQIKLGTSSETVVIPGRVQMASYPPASSSAVGAQGQIAWDSTYFYVCVTANSWRRIALATF